MSDVDVLVVRGSLVGSDVVVSPKLRVVVYGNPAHRLVSGALPRTGQVVEWTDQTVVDLTSFSFSSDGQGSRIALQRQDDFEMGLSYLRQYALDNEDTFVPRSYVTDDGYRLGRWIAVQREEFDADRLDPAKARALEAVPYWQWDPYEPVVGSESRTRQHHGSSKSGPVLVPLSSLPKPAGLSNYDGSGQPAPGRLAGPLPFHVWFERLEKFVASHGAARPSKGYVDPDGFRLGRWVSHLRDKGRRARLSADQIAALESLPGWSWSPKQEATPPAATPQVHARLADDEPHRDALGGPVGVLGWAPS